MSARQVAIGIESQDGHAVVTTKREFRQLPLLVKMPDPFSTSLHGSSVPRPCPAFRPLFAGPIQHAFSPPTALCPLGTGAAPPSQMG